ncbi:HAMP domain-containing histidine kinase, partial [Candidatus Sumerlaeota bacterium]|nr:HAMP domain-containing histidine kinase [Candidatus Sumerlaeota bacterium]
HPDPDMPDALFDPKGIHDAVLNLVGNAVDAGRGRPEAKVSVTPRFKAAAQRISIVIEDNGPGIPVAIQKRIFEPFFSTKGSKGTGLGLAVTQKVIREHGGEISLHSNEGEGARFTIWLPHRAPPEDQP